MILKRSEIQITDESISLLHISPDFIFHQLIKDAGLIATAGLFTDQISPDRYVERETFWESDKQMWTVRISWFEAEDKPLWVKE